MDLWSSKTINHHSQSDHWHCTFHTPPTHLLCTWNESHWLRVPTTANPDHSVAPHMPYCAPSMLRVPTTCQSDHWHCTFQCTSFEILHTFCTPSMHLLHTWNESHWLRVPTTANQIIGIAPSTHLPHTSCTPPMHLPCTSHAPSKHLPCTFCTPPAHLLRTFHAPKINLIG